MEEPIQNPLLHVLQETFDKSAKQTLKTKYLKELNGVKKWTCYSDYSFDNKEKANDVISFTLVPYIDDFEDLSKHIKSLVKVDIKKTRKVDDKFIQFLKKYPILNFSFILDDRKNLFSNNQDDLKVALENTLKHIRNDFNRWKTERPEQEEYYNKIDKQLKCVLELIKNKKKLKIISDMLLITFLGAYVSSFLADETKAEIFGWFSDRDAINEICENVSIDIFNYYFATQIEHNCQFVAAPAASTDNAFYEELVRIPDYITGALADYNHETDQISKDKFDTVLTEFMAENEFNSFVFKVKFDSSAGTSCSRLLFHKKEEKK